MSKTKHAQGINDEIMEKLNLQNRYAFLNANLSSILSDDEMEFLKEVEDFCVKFEKDNKITHAPDEDIYEWIPAFGKEGYITRMYPFSEIDLNYEKYGLTIDLLRGLAIDQFDPQYLMMLQLSNLTVNFFPEQMYAG